MQSATQSQTGQSTTRARVLALPGLLCDEYVWQQQAESLADVADVFIADLSTDDDIVEMARSALAQLDRANDVDAADRIDSADRIDVVGHSMGGRVAFEIWRLAPDRVRSLVVLDTGVHGPRDGEAQARQALLDVSAADGMRALAHVWLPPMVHPDRRDDATFMAPLVDMVCRATPHQHARQIAALLSRPDATALLPTITVPTLVVVGSDDEWSPVVQHAAIAAAVKGARLEVIASAGHMVTLEQPDEVTRLLRGWLVQLNENLIEKC